MRSPSSGRPFYGWVIVFALSVAGSFSVIMGIGNFGLFINPMSEELGIGQTPFGWAHTARLVGFALSGPLIGKLLDRYGGRFPLAVAALLYGLCAASLGLISQGWQMIALFFWMGAVGFWGSSSLYFTVPVAKWFLRQRAKAMSVVFVGVPLGIGVSAPVTQALIDAVGWRASWVVLAVVGSSVVALLSLLFVRNRPEDLGLAPDGAGVPPATQKAQRPPPGEHSWATSAALRTGTFWRLAIAFGALMFAMGAVSLFWVPYYTSNGFPAHLAALAFTTQAFTQVLASIVLSQLMDRVQPRFLAVGGFASFILALLLAMSASHAWHLFLAGFLSGAGIGTVMLLQAQIWPAYFGRDHIGAIRGLATPITLGSSALGGAFTGMLFDATGSYIPAWWLSVGVLALGGTLLGLSPKPAAKARSGAVEGARG